MPNALDPIYQDQANEKVKVRGIEIKKTKDQEDKNTRLLFEQAMAELKSTLYKFNLSEEQNYAIKNLINQAEYIQTKCNSQRTLRLIAIVNWANNLVNGREPDEKTLNFLSEELKNSSPLEELFSLVISCIVLAILSLLIFPLPAAGFFVC